MKIHMCIDVKGMLTKPLSKFKNIIHDDDGNLLDPHQARNYFLDELSKGHLFLPFGECDNFDYSKGCMGHADAN
jgi:hypothetical protein